MELSKDDIFKIIGIIEGSGYNDVRVEVGDFKLHVQKLGAGGLPVVQYSGQGDEQRRQATDLARPAAAPQQTVARTSAEEPIPQGAMVVRSPMLGTFFRAPSPGEKPFVEVGAKVAPDDTVCLVEVMKLFNSITAGVSGTVVKILAENAAMVEHGQLLMYIQPD